MLSQLVIVVDRNTLRNYCGRIYRGGAHMGAEFGKSRFEYPKRTVAFVDLLGYSALVLNSANDDQKKFEKLQSIYINLTSAAQTCVADLQPYVPRPVRLNHFSDAFFFSSASTVSVVTTVAQFFAHVFGFYTEEHIRLGD